jgi:hypothetical protein
MARPRAENSRGCVEENGGSVIALLPLRWRIRYRTMKLRALMWLLQRLMVRAERRSRPEGRQAPIVTNALP